MAAAPTHHLFILTMVICLLQFATTAPTGNEKLSGCDDTTCQLPDCLCMSTSAPSGLTRDEIPQLVFLTFDDSMDDWTLPFYEEIVRNRYNPNGCPISLTFFVRHDRTNYQAVNSFYNRRHEIASHTVTHESNRTYWSEGTSNLWKSEIDQQRDFLSTYGNIPKNQIKGFRSPYLQSGGDTMFHVLQSLGMIYDSTMSSSTYRDPPLWPYTLDFGLSQDCHSKPCPNDTYPGMWEMPIVSFQDRTGSSCNMIDSCAVPDTADEEFDYLLNNFLRYNATRSPFSLYAHPYWFRDYDYILEGYLRFVDYLASFDNVYFVTVQQGIEWLRHPLAIDQLGASDVFSCSTPIAPAPCQSVDCAYSASIPGGSRVMKSCSPCPDAYPWVNVAGGA